MTDEARECATNCFECQRTCIETMGHCLSLGGRHADSAHLELMMDCADICGLHSRFLARGSEFHHHLSAACRDICDACADSCRKRGDDERMKECEAVCRRCAESCERMMLRAA
jgi:hypothetical protein